MERQIIHIEVDSFVVAVERIVNSRLRNRPVIMANSMIDRAVVQAVSPEARQAGVDHGMLLPKARMLCRDIIVIPPNEPLYSRAMQAMLKLMSRFTPLIEPVSYGHAYLDMTGTTRLFGATVDAAAKIQREIQSQLLLPTSLGLASNKLVSKVASEIIKPVGIREVQPGMEQEFMGPLQIQYLPAVEPTIKKQLSELNINVIKEIANIPLPHLTMIFGREGLKLHQAARGIDYTPVFPPQQVPNIYAQTTLPEDTNDIHLLRGALYPLVEKVGRQLRQSFQTARKMILEIYYSDHREAIGQQKLPVATNMDQDLFQVAEELLHQILTRRIRVRKLAVRYFQLTPISRQMSLFHEPVRKANKNLIKAIDQIRKKFGEDSIKLALVNQARSQLS